MYTIIWEAAAERALSRLPKDVQPRLVAAVNQLAENPRPPGCLKVKGTKDEWRIRVGRYRVVYRIVDRQLEIWVIDADHRRDIY